MKGRVFDLTLKWNTIAVVSNGTRVLGLENIGPEAALPVMEGKLYYSNTWVVLMLYHYTLKLRMRRKIVEIVKAVEPSFGGINLEDIEKPKCFLCLIC